MTRDDIPTPALLLDLDRFERNIRRMAAHARAAGKNLRPHAKTHRCPEVARRQVSAGALGVACAKLGEAEVMARAGVRGLLITTEVVAPAAIRRLTRLVSAAPDTLLVVDNAANVADLAREAAADGVTLNLLVDVDVGTRRTGIAPGEPALALARAVAAQPALRFRGLQGYAGHCAHVIGWEARRAASRAALAPLMETRALIEGGGLPVDIVAGGSTGTWDMDVELPGLTELQAGSYCVMDIDYRRIGGRAGAMNTDFEMALTVVTTVVSVPTSERAMVDGGLKAFSTDKPFPPESVERPGVEYSFAGAAARRAYRVLPAALRPDDQPLRPDLRDACGQGRGRVGDRRARPVRLRTWGAPGAPQAPRRSGRPGVAVAPLDNAVRPSTTR